MEGHLKVIQSGRVIEIYRYENPAYIPHKPRKKKTWRTNTESIGRRRDNIHRQRKSFVRLVRANLFSDFVPSLLTLTMQEIAPLPHCNGLFKEFINLLRERFDGIKYIAVPEFQKRGAVHYHLIVWGLPDEIVLNERESRYLQILWGHGFVDIIKTDGSPRLASYLSKYMTKVLDDPRMARKKAYMTSRAILRPSIHKGKGAKTVLSYAKEIWDLDLSTAIPCYEREFQTEWLGGGLYKMYII